MSMRLAGGAFAPFHADVVGRAPDWSDFDPGHFPPGLLELARRTWLDRTHSELRSVKIMTRFLQEVAGANAPLDVLSWAADLVRDEVRHAALCRQACLALGVEPTFPKPEPEDPAEYRAAPARDRATTTALSMLAINESISAAFIADLAKRCSTPGLSDVLRSTIEDEEGHGAVGWDFVAMSLSGYPRNTWSSWRHLVRTTLEPHLMHARRGLAEPSDTDRDAAYAALGLLSARRQAEVFARAYEAEVRPRLSALDLAPPVL